MKERAASTEPEFWKLRTGVGLVIFLAVGLFFLREEHQAHILGALPLILIVGVCLAMHFFMHGGSDNNRGSTDRKE